MPTVWPCRRVTLRLMADPEYMTDAENDVLDAGEQYAKAWAELQRRKQEGWPFSRQAR